jgi:integrase
MGKIMPREAGPRLDDRSRRWIVQMGDPSPTTGRRGRVILRDEHGNPIEAKDKAGAFAAYAALLRAKDEEKERRIGPSACDVVNAFLKWHEAHGSMPDTVATHEWHLGKFLEFEHRGVKYNDRPAATFEVADWSRYRKDMEGRGLATGTIRLAYSSVHACWHWASRPIEDREPLRLISENPFCGLPRPKKGKGRRLVLPFETVLAMASFVTDWADRPVEPGMPRNQKVAINRERCRNRLKALACRLIIESGCRPKETAMLRWDWLHEDERAIEIPEELIKNHKDRHIPLRPAMADTLRAMREGGNAHPVWVFVPRDYADPEPMDAKKLAEWFVGARSAARSRGINLPKGTSLYTFRHTLITLANEAGLSLDELAPAFGHSRTMAEKTYAHPRRGRIVEIMDMAWEKLQARKEKS